jgi:hypothetical protein
MKKLLTLTTFVALLGTKLLAMPTVTTGTATDITATTARLNGTAVQNENPISAKGFEWKLSTATQWTTVTVGGTDTSFSTTLSGLTPETTYDFRAFARVSISHGFITRYGGTVSFETTAENTSIAEIDDRSLLQVFPNPTGGELHIVIPSEARNLSNIVEFYDMNGKRVFFTQIPLTTNHSPLTINVSHLPSGTYIVKIGSASVKIVKQ